MPDYLMWMLVAPKEMLLTTEETCPAALHALVRERTRDWHPDLCRVLECADIPATFPVSISTACPVPAWPAGRVTLLDDAIHTMTPAGGIGANTALRDAVLLARTLTAVDRRESDLIAAIASYETTIRDYGFAAVERSLRSASQLYRIPAGAGEGLS